nr:MFS transporter [Lentzea sp. NBRC 105346]
MTRGWGRLQAVVVASSSGEGLLMTAVPWLAATITTDPRTVSLVKAVWQAPWLLFALFAGVVIDRVRRTSVLAFAYVVLGSAALALAVAPLSIPLLLVVALTVGTAQVFGECATGALVPGLVGRDRLTAANTRLIMLEAGLVRFVAPPLAGFLVAWFAGGSAWVAVACAVAALLLVRAIPAERPVRSEQHPLRDIAEGLRFLVGTRLLRTISIVVALGSFGSGATTALLVLFTTNELHIGAFGFGVMLACLAAGWIASSFFADRLVARVGYPAAMRGAQIGMAVTLLAFAVIPPWPALAGFVLFSTTAVVLVWNVCSQSTRQRFTPSELLGRVLTSHKTLTWGLMPLGALAGGFMAAEFGLRSVWLMAGLLHVVNVLIVWRVLTPAAFENAQKTAPV